MEKREQRFPLRMPIHINEKLDEIKNKTNISKNELILLAINEYIKNHFH